MGERKKKEQEGMKHKGERERERERETEEEGREKEGDWWTREFRALPTLMVPSPSQSLNTSLLPL